MRISRRQMRVDGPKWLPCPAVAEQLCSAHVRVCGEKPQQLAADIARGSKDGRPNHERTPITAFAYLCKKMYKYSYERQGPTTKHDCRADPQRFAGEPG